MDAAGIVALAAGLGGVLLSQLSPLVPVRKDFVAGLKLKKESCLERLAVAHCVLIKACQDAWGTEFEDRMRGDGRTTRDQFAEFASTNVEQVRYHFDLSDVEKSYRFWHACLSCSIALLLLYGGAIAVFGVWPFSTWIACALVMVEITAFVFMYLLNNRAEKIP